MATERGAADRDVAAAVVAALAAAGTRALFGVPGGGSNLEVVGAAAETGLPFVLAHGETAATIMAATTADLTGAPGAVVVTRGPGLASAVNGIAHAALDRLPVVVVTDSVPAAAGRVSHQRLDQRALGGATHLVAPVPAALAVLAEGLDRIWGKYTGNEPPYGLRDPSINERRVLFELRVVSVATFGRP